MQLIMCYLVSQLLSPCQKSSCSHCFCFLCLLLALVVYEYNNVIISGVLTVKQMLVKILPFECINNINKSRDYVYDIIAIVMH